MTIMQFGKHAGKDISEVPEPYLDWMIRDSDEKLLMCKAEIERRKIKVEDSVMSTIVQRGFNELASIPGNDVKKLELARDRLMDAIRAAAQPKTSP